MPRFNTPTAPQVADTRNLAGGEAFSEDQKLELASLIITSMVQDQYYRTAEEGLDRLRTLLDVVDPLFAAKAAIYARHEHGLRSITHIIAGELAHRVKGEQWTKRFFDRIVRRADDITEILAYHESRYGRRPIPNALKKGLAVALGRQPAFALARYRGADKKWSLVDAVNLTHPKAGQNAEAMSALVADTLRQEQNWEAQQSKAGQTEGTEEEKAEAKAANWAEIVRSGNLGYFALLRNLRNIMEQAPEVIPRAIEQLTNPESIKRSLVLPFRYATAWDELKKVPGGDFVLPAIAIAADIALENVPELPGKTLVMLDESGSMRGKPITDGSLFAAALYKANNADLITFSNNARWRSFDKTVSILNIAQSLRDDFSGGGTAFSSAFLLAKERVYDRIVILSDMQSWMETGGIFTALDTRPTTVQQSFTAYRVASGADPHLYSFDLQGYGTLQFPQPKVYAMAGFSEKIFDVMKLLEQDRGAFVAAIEAVEV